MATWRSAEPSSAGCLDLAECVRTNRKTLAPNQKQLSAEVRRRAVVSEVGAARFEPKAPTDPPKRACHSKQTDAHQGMCGCSALRSLSLMASEWVMTPTLWTAVF